MKNIASEKKYAVIGAGPCGISAIRCFQKKNIPVQGFEIHKDVGGLWDIDNPMSTVYQSAHLISSKSQMEIKEFPFDKTVAEYPHHKPMKKYFHGFAKEFDLRKLYRFRTKVVSCERTPKGQWEITSENLDSGERKTQTYRGLVIANGIFNNPNIPKFKGQESFKGEIIHSSKYKDASMFKDKRVLIVGAGNTGCDIAVDAVHHAKSVDMSVRRGYYFVPKYIFGKPADTIGGKFKLPPKLQTLTQGAILKAYIPDPTKYGFPKPKYKPFESHPVVNSLLLHHLGHGDLEVMSDIERLDGNTVHFKKGEKKEYDLIMCCTGYSLNYPFIDKKYLNWPEDARCPQLHLNIFHPEFDNLFVLGMVEATGIGWQGRYDQAELVSEYIKNLDENKTWQMKDFIQEKTKNETDLRGGMKYIKLDRMSFYVHKETYLKKLRADIKRLQEA